MPVSTRSKAKAAGKRGAKTARDSASEKRAKRLDNLGELERLREELAGVREENTSLRTELEEIRRNYEEYRKDVTEGRHAHVTAAEWCRCRLGFESEDEKRARDNRDLTLGEQVIRNPLIRDQTLQGLNPYKLSDLQSVLGLREFYKLLPDVDLKECYFEGAWGFRKEAFVLANWREMSVGGMKQWVRRAHPDFDDGRVYPPGKVDVDTLNTKEEILRAFWELTYVPVEVYRTAVAGAHVLRSVKAGDVGEDPDVVQAYFQWACQAGLDASVIRGLFDSDGADCFSIQGAAWCAAEGGHTDVLDLMASEFDAWIGVDCLVDAAGRGHDTMIDHLVEKYGVDPNGADEDGWTALHRAAYSGRVRTVKHLVEKYNVDIHQRKRDGETALDSAGKSRVTECADYLRELMSTRPPPS